MIDDPLAALGVAWRVSLVATTMLFAALAVASVWDTAIYVKALHQALLMDHF
jgi:hypothetical protein